MRAAALLALLLLAAPAQAATPLVIGISPCCSHISGETAQADVAAVDAAVRTSGVTLDLVMDFVGISGPHIDMTLARLPADLETAWRGGRIPVINLMSLYPLTRLAFPQTAEDWAEANLFFPLAEVLRAWGEQGGGRLAYLVPWPEANCASCADYYDSPEAYKHAVGKLRWVLEHVGALPYVRLVWGPSVMWPGAPRTVFEDYFPAGWVDAVGMSAFLFLGCDPGQPPITYETGIAPWFARLRAVAPGLPILLLQTGIGDAAPQMREILALDLFQRLKAEPGVSAVIWFNRPGNPNNCQLQLSPEQWGRVVAPLDWRRP